MNKKTLKTTGFVVLGLSAFIVLVLSLSPYFSNSLFAQGSLGANQPPVKVSDNVNALNKAFQAASDAVIPSVVSISVVIENKAHSSEFRDQFRDFFKYFGEQFDEAPQESEASGSGVFATEDGYIITNYHVVENAKDIKVTTYDKKEHKAKLIGTDPLTDLALIKIDGSTYPAVHFAKMEDVKIGEWVLAVGNPLGLNSTITAGIVSAIGRGGLSLLKERGPSAVENFIQTDAAINPGNSGGGLFNLEGSLVGINTAIATRTGTYIGYGFAIPVDLVKAVIMDLKEDGKIHRGQLGVQIRSLDEVMAKSLKLDKVEGVLVNEVVKGSAAEKAGIEDGDVILEVDGKAMSTSNELQSVIAKKHAGEKVNLVIWRDAKKINKTVTLQPRDTKGDNTNEEAKPADDEDSKDIGATSFDKLGFSVKALTQADKETYDVQNGVLISKVERNSEVLKRGVAPNGVITKADRVKITSVKDLKKIIESKKSGEAVMLQIKYKDSNRIIAIEIP